MAEFKNLILRDYKSTDYEQISELWKKIDLAGAARKDDKEVIERTIKNGGKLIILEEINLNQIIGTSWLTTDSRRLYLHHFGIKPGFQGKRYAKLLIEKSLDYARKSGLQVKLEVHRRNTKAIEFYKNAGFTFLGDYDVYMIRKFN